MNAAFVGLGRVWIAVVAIFLLAPIIVTALVSFSPSAIFDLPWDGFSLRWYQRLGRQSSFWEALSTSAWIAGIATGIAVALAVPAAIAISTRAVPGAAILANLLTAPLMLPGLVLGIAFLQAFRTIDLRDAALSLVLAHVAITTPYITRTLLASLHLFDYAMLDAARTLGSTWPGAIVKVMLPNLAPAVVSGGAFAFLASFDNYSISLFLVDVTARTLPVQVLNYLETGADPTIAAISTILLAMTVTVLVVVDRAIGLRRMDVS